MRRCTRALPDEFGGGMKFVESRPFTNPDVAARKLDAFDVLTTKLVSECEADWPIYDVHEDFGERSAVDVVAGRAIIGRTGAGDDLECFMIINYIFVLYCVVGCELSQPNHRIIRAFGTIERCDEVKRNVESAKTVYSCERTAFEKDK